MSGRPWYLAGENHALEPNRQGLEIPPPPKHVSWDPGLALPGIVMLRSRLYGTLHTAGVSIPGLGLTLPSMGLLSQVGLGSAILLIIFSTVN